MFGKKVKLSHVGVTVAAVALLAIGVFNPLAAADHQPADKIAVAGSGIEFMSTATTGGTESEVVSLASGTLKTSSPTDLIISFTAECALVTDIVVGKGNDKNAESGAFAEVKVWVEINGNPVPVASDDTVDPGEVVFCNRDFKMKFETDSPYNFSLETYLRTRSANAFQWIITDVGSDVHTIEVLAQVTKTVNGEGNAVAGVGKRTLVVQPVKLANDVTI